MTDETLSAAPELATAIPAVESAPEVEPENLELPASDEGEQPAVEPELDDFEEIEWSGKKFKAPKGLKDGVLMHADYTRKTQANAERVRELDTREERIAQQAKITEEELDARAHLRSINAEIERLKAFGWAEYQQARQSDPLGADEAWNYKAHLLQQKTEAETLLGQKQNERTQETQREAAKRIEDTLAFARSLPGMTQEIHKENLAFAKAKGVADHALAANMNPVVYEMIHLARIGSQVLAKQKAAPKPGGNSPAPQPLTTVGGKTNPETRKSLADMDMEEYAAARKAGRKS